MLRVWHGLETILNAFMEVSPRKTQSIPINRHFCHRCEAFLVRHFCCSEFNPRLMPGKFRASYSENK